MILQRLVEYYDRLSTDLGTASLLPKPGYSLQKISFCVTLDPDGSRPQFQSMLDQGPKKPLPRQLLVPGQSKPTGAGINPCFLWDNAAYALGFKPDDTKPDRTRESFEAFRERHVSLAKKIDSPAFQAVCKFLKSWSPQKANQHAAELADITGSFGVFKIASQRQYVHDDPAVAAYWAACSSGDDDSTVGQCLVTGRTEPIARLHEPKIKGVRDTQSAGALLVSFNDKAYESLGREQGDNAPVSQVAAFKYTNALNYLLSRSDCRVSLGDATIVFWAEQATVMEEFAKEFFTDGGSFDEDASAEDHQRAQQVRLFLSQLREGHSGAEAIDPESAVRFFVLGMSPNASRISIRFWVDTTVGEMKQRLGQHLRDIELVGARERDPPLVIRRIVAATGRAETDTQGRLKGYDADSISPLLAGAIARAVLLGGPYPQILLAAMVRRLRHDGVINHPRVAAIKACLVRNSRLQGKRQEDLVALDLKRTEPGYVTGRLFALLEKAQADSVDGDLNTTIKDRYFSSASATPAVVFPRLLRLSQHHLAKLDTGLKISYEKRISEVIGKLDSFPRHLNLQDQGLFAVGYFHQRQDLFTSKKDKQGDTA